MSSSTNTGIMGNQQRFRLTASSISGIALLAILAGLFYFALHTIHVNQIAHPAVMMCLPVVGITWVASSIPLLIFLTYQDDFKGLNPLNPAHYVYIAKKSWRAMSSNNMKLTLKDL